MFALFGLAPAPGATNPLYSKGGIVLVMGIEHSTLVFLAVRAGLRNLPRDLIEAARLGGAHPLRVARSVILPLALPAILAGAALAFVASIGNFGIPALLGIPGRYTMLTTLIYQRPAGLRSARSGRGGGACARASPPVAVAGLLLPARGRAASRSRPGALRSSRSRLGAARAWAETLLWILLVVIAVMPLVALLAASLALALGVPLRFGTATLANYRFALLEQDATLRAFGNSLLLAFTTALVSAAVALPLAYFATLRQSRLARVLDAVAAVPYAVPGTVLAIAIILVFLPPVPAPRCQSLRHHRDHPHRVSGALSGAWCCGRRWPRWG